LLTGSEKLQHCRTYWGGALFCLMADVEIRKRTGNSKGLRDALRGINHAGGSIEADWPLERALKIGDQVTDGSTLTELYGKMASKAVAVDLTRLWEELGVRRSGQGIALDDQAPWAAIRAAICGFTKTMG
jgi:predicted metalloprotease with PDZ domain